MMVQGTWKNVEDWNLLGMHCAFAPLALPAKLSWVEQVLTEFIFLSFNHRNKKKLKIGIWYTVNCLFYIYTNRTDEARNMVENIKKQMFWHLTLERWISNRNTFYELYDIVRKGI